MTDHEKHLQTLVDHFMPCQPCDLDNHYVECTCTRYTPAEILAAKDYAISVLERLPLLEATRRMWLAQRRVRSYGLSAMELEAAFAESREAGDALRALEAKAKGEP